MAEDDRSFLNLVRRRCSVRAYADRPVAEEALRRCLEAARLAPSACNAQPWRFVVVDDPGLKDRVAAQAHGGVLPLNHFTRQAPVIVALVMEPANFTSRIGSAVKRKHFPLIDIGIAAEHFCLQAAEEGLGTCMLGWFKEDGVRTLLKIPESSRPVLLITLGHPARIPPSRKRKPIDAIVSRNRY